MSRLGAAHRFERWAPPLAVAALRDGPIGSFAIEVVRDLARRGDLAPARAHRLEHALRELSEQEARSADPERVAVVGASSCAAAGDAMR